MSGRRAAVALVALALAPGSASATTFARANQVGFRPQDPKRVLVQSSRSERGAGWRVLAAGGNAVRRGRLRQRLGAWSPRFAFVYAIDLSGLRRPGRYRLRLAGRAVAGGRFTIAAGSSLYRPLLGNAVRYYQSVRDGADVIGSVLDRRPAHLSDRAANVYAPPRYRADLLQGNLVATGTVADVSGGWFDAGDYIKLAQTASYTTAVMLLADRDEAARFPSPDALRAETRFGLDWLARMWDDATGTLYYQVGIGDGNGTTVYGDHDLWRLPQADDRLGAGPGSRLFLIQHRPAFRAGPPGATVSPNLAGRLAAAFGLCAQVLRGSDSPAADRCLLAGEHVYDLARTTPGPLLTASPSDYYPETEWRDDMTWGAAELARALQVGAATPVPHADPGYYLDRATTFAGDYLARNRAVTDTLNLYDTSALAFAELADALAAQPVVRAHGRRVPGRARLLAGLRDQLNAAATVAAHDPFSLGITYGGGDATPHALGIAVTAVAYERLGGSPAYRALGQHELDWVLGANAWGTSFVVGAGSRFPRCLQSQIANLAGSLRGHGRLQLGATVDGPNEAAAFTDLGLPDGARSCPSRGVDRNARFDGRGARYMDDARAWPAPSRPSTTRR